MKKIILIGHGRMGCMIEDEIANSADLTLLGVVDTGLFAAPDDIPGEADALLDFSYPGNLNAALRFGAERGCPLVLGTTGYDARQRAEIAAASSDVAIVHSANFSLGVAALRAAAMLLAPMLMPGFDAEIVETHHHNKADAPSGTAKMLLDTIDPHGDYAHVYGRSGITGARGKEIGVHALRGGSVAGEHSVFFFGEDEMIELRHSAESRRVFAKGALRAARFVCGRAPGLYGMDDVLKEALS